MAGYQGVLARFFTLGRWKRKGTKGEKERNDQQGEEEEEGHEERGGEEKDDEGDT